MRFGDRNVVVTGSAQGIGRGIVQAFLDEGASVFAADIDADGLRGTAALAPERVRTHTLDLADFDGPTAEALRRRVKLLSGVPVIRHPRARLRERAVPGSWKRVAMAAPFVPWISKAR